MKNNLWKRSFLVGLSFACLVSSFTGCGSEPAKDSGASDTSVAEVSATKTPADYKGTVSFWGWDQDAIMNSVPKFNETFPNIKMEFIVSPGDEYLKKIQTTVATGMDLPDIIQQNMQDRGSLYAIDGLLEDLSTAPYNVDKSKILEVGLDNCTDEQGKLVGIPWDLSVSGLMYRRDLTKQYLGTDDPAELAKMIPNWDTMIKIGKDVKAKTNGKVYMFPGINDLLTCSSGQSPAAVANGNTLNFSEVIKPQLELAMKFKDAGICDKLDLWTPGWTQAFADGNHMFFGGPVWGIRWMAEANDKDGKGRWGLMESPDGGFTWGGSAMGIAKSGKNKEAAWQYLNWLLLSKEGTQYSKDKLGFIGFYKPSFEDASYVTMKNDFFAGQDIGAVYKTIADKTKVRLVSKFDNELLAQYSKVSTSINTDPKITLDAVIKMYQDNMKAKFPDIEIK